MLFISHRGNLNGPLPERENSPDYVDEAIAAGFIVEVDLTIEDGWPILGHKNQRYPVSWSWLHHRAKHLLLHLKNTPAVWDISRYTRFHYFCNEKDEFSLTSRGYILYWSRNVKNDTVNRYCLLPFIDKETLWKYPQLVHGAGGVISDYAKPLKELNDINLTSREP